MENFFPPAPCDVIVALGAFLSHNGVIDPWAVFSITIGVNLLGTIAVYGVARRFGPSFLATRTGRRLLPPAAIVWMEREYLRFGIAGIFISRLLPGFRSFVAPFAGLANLSPAKTLIPIAAAATLWYGFLVYVGVQLGEEWEAINRIISRLNRTLAIFGGLLVVGLVLWMLLRRRRTRHDRLRSRFQEALARAGAGGKDPTASAGAATVLFELAQGDEQIPREDLLAIEARLREEWGLGEPSDPAQDSEPAALKDTAELRTLLTERYDLTSRLELADRLLRIVSSDGVISRHENRLMHRAADLLGMTPDDLADARRRVRTSSGTPGTTSASSVPPHQTPST
ncbi:MAG TPA: VTT domain-containing protein [Gemmatimonadales bacterium]|nr:VTT domain-containing protein [Gemmatimonadales bacterium]